MFPMRKNQYIAWLLKTFREDIGVDLSGVDPGRTSILKHESKTVGEQMSFTVKPTLTLTQLVKFLNAFYSEDTLHRITLLKLTPKTERAGSKRTRTGEIIATIEIQVLSLVDAMKRSQLPAVANDPGLTMDQAMESIVRRDVFDAANNPPTLKANKSSSYTSGRPVSVALIASDVDDGDALSIELIESSVDEAKLDIDEDRPRGKLLIPGQEAGRYKFLLRVTDNGLPEKSTDQSVDIVFRDPPTPKKPTPPKPTPPPLKQALETRITGNLRNSDGSWSVLIKSRMDGQSYRLKTGESFTLDDEKWEVTDITSESATFSVDGEKVSVDRGTAFSEVR